MKKTKFLLLLLILLLPACGKGDKTPTPGPEVVYTSAAQTVAVQLTENALKNPSATPTNTITPLPTATKSSAALPVSTATKALQVTVPPTLPVSNDLVEFIGTEPDDGARFTAGESFTVTWTVRNAGQTTWTTSYQLRFYSSDRMGASLSNSYSFPKKVLPGETVSLTAEFIAPAKAGAYKSIWVLTNADGLNFYPVYIEIIVGNASATATATEKPTVQPTETATAEGG